MQKIAINQRPNWQEKAEEYGFNFHTMYGQPYWCEEAYYQFTLNEVETIEDATKELHEMCLHVVDKVVSSEQLLDKFCIPRHCWDLVKDAWAIQQPSLYSRLDLAFDGKSAPKLLENNADTPTSLFEAAFFQWIWLEDQINNGNLPQHADQFNSLQEKIIERFTQLKNNYKTNKLYFSCCRDTDEDRGTVQYLQDCADEAGLFNEFIYIDDIGLGERGEFTDINDYIITNMFKLYPWEEMFRDIFSTKLADCGVRWLEPAWKSIISNKCLLPQLWEMFPNHPNLLPAYFMDEASSKPPLNEYVIKPVFSREGANIQIIKEGKELCSTSGPYGDEKQIIQAYQPLPKFENNYMLIGSWLINNEPAGMGIREDTSMITQDLSRFYPHIILG